MLQVIVILRAVALIRRSAESSVTWIAHVCFVLTILLATVALATETDYSLEATYDRWLGPDWTNQLYLSENPEHLLAGALLSAKLTDSDHSAEDYFSRALTADPGNILILFDLANFCQCRSYLAVCGKPYLERLAKLDALNGAVWTIRAWRSYRAGESATALSYLRRAATAEVFDDYFIRHLVLFDSVLRAYQPHPAKEHFVVVFGLAAGQPVESAFMFKVCREEAAVDAEWRDVCLQLGQTMELRGLTDMTSSLGLSLQIRMLELSHEPKELAAAKARLQRRREVRQNWTGIEQRFASDDHFWGEYFDTFIKFGETAAHELAAKRLEAGE